MLYDSTNKGSVFEVVDNNLTRQVDKDNLFTFSIHSDNSIVKNMDMSFETPQSGLQNMIAIQNSTNNIPIHVKSTGPGGDDENVAMKIVNGLYQSEDDSISYGIRYLPFMGNNAVVKKQETSINTTNLSTKPPSLLEVSRDDTVNLTNFAKNMNITPKALDKEWEKEHKKLADYAVPDNSIKSGDVDDKDPINEKDLFPGAYFASSMEEYYTTLAKKTFFKTDLQSIIPVNLSLEIYGMNGD